MSKAVYMIYYNSMRCNSYTATITRKKIQSTKMHLLLFTTVSALQSMNIDTPPKKHDTHLIIT
jgi:hypothetical protein